MPALFLATSLILSSVAMAEEVVLRAEANAQQVKTEYYVSLDTAMKAPQYRTCLQLNKRWYLLC